jgi:hypothetical protein
MVLMAEHAALRQLCISADRIGAPVTRDDVTPRPRPRELPSLARALPERRSVRQFASGPVPSRLLEFACQTGLQVERAGWPAVVHGECGIGIGVAAWDVTGLPRGIYRYLPAERRFVPVTGPEILGGLRSAYAPAPALLLVYGSLDKAREHNTANGYQRLLVRAGALGYAAQLAALSTGLWGCPFGSASSSVTRSLHTGQQRLHHLFTVAVGWPADS